MHNTACINTGPETPPSQKSHYQCLDCKKISLDVFQRSGLVLFDRLPLVMAALESNINRRGHTENGVAAGFWVVPLNN
jgi:hypothetical protein